MNGFDGAVSSRVLAALARFWHEVAAALIRGLQRGHY